jgi:hypothetical protein
MLSFSQVTGTKKLKPSLLRKIKKIKKQNPSSELVIAALFLDTCMTREAKRCHEYQSGT